MKLTQWLTLAAGLGVLACATDPGTLTSGQARNGDGDADGDESPSGDAGKSGGSGTRRDGGTRGSGGSGGSNTGNGDNTCDALTVAARPNSPEILIVLDRSGSMVGLGGTQNLGRNRWQGSMSAVQKVTEQLTETVAFGLMTFPARATGIGGIPGLGGATNTCQAGRVDVPVATNSAAMIAATLRSATPDYGATPTAATLEAARGALNGRNGCVDCFEAPKFVLLVTDGQPTCGASGSGDTTPADIEATSAAIDKLREDGILTYVVGYDTVNDPAVASTMDQFAQRGGTERHFPVENETTLVNELIRIASALVPCEYELASEVDDPNYVRVTIDGEQQNLSDGAWRIEGNKIILEGACDKLKDAKAHDLRIVRECELVNVI